MNYLKNNKGALVRSSVKAMTDMRGNPVLKDIDGSKEPVMVDNLEALKADGFQEISKDEYSKLRKAKVDAKAAPKKAAPKKAAPKK